MNDALPLGPIVDATPAPLPGPVTLPGRFGTVTRLVAAKHAGPLWDAVRGHDAIWTYLPTGPFSDQQTFSSWLESVEKNPERTFYAIVDGSGRAVGLSALMEIRPAMRVIEVGHIVYSPALQRTPLGTEAQFLLARYAFETLRYRRYEWKCSALNAASRRAAERYGFTYEGLFRQHMIVKGHSRDTAWFSILDSEWPARKAAFERWLAPENFSDGRQRTKLGQA